VLLGAALAAWPLRGGDPATPALVVLAALSLAALAGALVWPRLLGLVLAGLAAELVTRDLAGSLPAEAVVACGAALLLLCELVAWAGTLRGGRVEWAVIARRALRLASVTLLGAVAAGVTLAAGSASPPSTFLAGLAAAAAVAGLVALVLAAGRRAA
jgi:hypothetical protein